MLKKIIKAIIPTWIIRILRPLKPEYCGNYTDFEEAKLASTGYDSTAVFEKVRNARLAVERGEAVYERDSVLFKEKQIFAPLLSALRQVAEKNKGELSVLDFGGSLGSTFFQNEDSLKNLSAFHWSIVEQQHFVEFGKEHFKNHPILAFYKTISEAAADQKIHVVLFSSTLQYLEKPFNILEQVFETRVPYILFDRTTILENQPDRITLQHPHRKAYTEVTFPAWLFNEDMFINVFKDHGYSLVSSWASIGDPIQTSHGLARNKGYLFEHI